MPRPTQQTKLDVEDVDEDDERVEESSLDEDEGSDVNEEEDDGEENGEDSDGGVTSKIKVREVQGDRIDVDPDSSSMLADDADEADAVASVASSTSAVQPEQHGGEEMDGSEPLELDDTDEASSKQDHTPSEHREAKRRKLSISPLPSSESPLMRDTDPSETYAKEEQSDADMPYDSSNASDFDGSHSPSLKDRHGLTEQQPQPTFRAPPRFKALDQDDTTSAEGLPAAFSPQRHGPKYLAGGLAIELQGWLSEVKGWGGADGWTGPRFRVVLEAVRPGTRMYLTRYKRLDDPGRSNAGEGGSSEDGASGRLILAGEGRLTGLNRRADVGAGSVVEVNHPVWDIELEGHTWMVACDWAIE